MSKYYLLTFCEDYADEHDVPALACMTEKEYNKWLERSSGELNVDYDNKKLAFDLKLNDNNKLVNEYKKRGLYTKRIIDYTEEEMEWKRKNPLNFISTRDSPKKVKSYIRAHLGNSGEGFEESYEHLYLMKEFVEENIVKVTEVDKSFYDIFKKADLSRLNLCNIFNENLDGY